MIEALPAGCVVRVARWDGACYLAAQGSLAYGDTRPTLRFGPRVSPRVVRCEWGRAGTSLSAGLLLGGSGDGGVDVQIAELGGVLVVGRHEFVDVAELEAFGV